VKKLSPPPYLNTYKAGRLSEKTAAAHDQPRACTLCPRMCRANRLAGEIGVCKTPAQAIVASFDAHFGEESALVGNHGSGTIFFTHCNLLCNFCQNYDISHYGQGATVDDNQLAKIMLHLQEAGCHNINFVTPSHVVPQILNALLHAIPQGLEVPLVFNSSAYDRVETLEFLDGVVDLYMPDFKFWDPEVADATCGAPDYPKTAQSAVAEMHRQVGDLTVDKNGIALRGLLIRHLVLPEGLAGTQQVMGFIANDISKNSYVNIMPQYRPCGDAASMAKLSRTPTADEFESAVQSAKDAGIVRLDRPERRFLIW